MVESGRRLRQHVGRLQARPAVGAADEFLRQAELHLRMPGEVGEFRDAQGLRAILAHGERIAVVEAERDARLEPLRGERPVQLGKRRTSGQADDLGSDGAGVFGIDVDRAGLERGSDDAGVAEPRLVLTARGSRQDLAEDVGLGEALGADLEAVCGVRRARQREQNDDCGFQEAMRSTSTRQS